MPPTGPPMTMREYKTKLLELIEIKITDALKKCIQAFSEEPCIKVMAHCGEVLEELNAGLFQISPQVLKAIALDAMLLVDKIITDNERAVISVGILNYYMITPILMEPILFPFVQYMDAAKLKNRNSQKGLIACIKYLKEIVVLKLPENCPRVPTLAVNIKELKKLEQLELLKSCNNDVIRTLGENSPNMNYLDISFSEAVKDKCVPYLLNLKKLTYLNISSTSISVYNYKIILSELKLIRNISWREDGIEEILTDIDEEILKNKTSFEGTFNAPKILVERCPNIRFLTIVTARKILDFTPISYFRKLRLIRVDGVNVTLCNVRNAFRSKLGYLLRDLHLKSIEELNITIIIECCVKLRSLSIENCKFSSDEINVVPTMQHFLNLKNLSLMFNTGDKWYLNNVKYYKNLTTLNADSVDGLNDNFFKEAFENGAFEKLDEFTVRKGGALSIKTARLLLNSCPDLKVIGYIKEWTNLTLLEIEKIMKKIENNNLNVKVL